MLVRLSVYNVRIMRLIVSPRVGMYSAPSICIQAESKLTDGINNLFFPLLWFKTCNFRYLIYY